MTKGVRSCAVLSCAICVALSSFGCLGGGDAAPETRKRVTLTEEAAVERALETLGFEREGLVVTAKAVSLPDRPLPFVQAPEDRTAWLVHVNGVVLTHKYGQMTVTNPYIHSLAVLISAATGQVVSITSPPPTGKPEMRPFPSIETYERTSPEKIKPFVGMPCSSPKITFLNAVAKTNFRRARQIVAYYVIQKHVLPTVREVPVWAVHCWGIPPFEPIGRYGTPPGIVPVRARDHLRYSIDAATGTRLSITNKPAS